jgi:hypothetical protein
MGAPRVFVGFSSTDFEKYQTLRLWQGNENIEFEYCSVQLERGLNSSNERYIKDRCRERINMAGTFALLIGNDTRFKEQYVLWEAEVAIEKGCRLIGVNLDDWRVMNPSTSELGYQLGVNTARLPERRNPFAR